MVAREKRSLNALQVRAIRTAMQLFVEDDLGKAPRSCAHLACDACEQARPAEGFIQYGRYQVCNRCATNYEIAHAKGLVETPGQYIRDQRFGGIGFL
jgi:hypothetical protein